MDLYFPKVKLRKNSCLSFVFPLIQYRKLGGNFFFFHGSIKKSTVRGINSSMKLTC